jgi:hypothetical protein
MAFRTSPNLGPQLDDVFKGLPYWDLALPDVTDDMPSYKLGNVEIGNDGALYLWVMASATISATNTTGTELAITLPGFTAAAGTQGWFTPPATALAEGDYFHARRGAYGSVTEPVT